jgi:UDP-N-acetylglucosamine:LPS N-acetylglucosamine transferase
MGKKILIPYLSAGLGHMILAQAIAHFVHRMRPDWDVRLMDAARDLDDELLQKTFVDLWKVFLGMPPFVSTALFALERLAPRAARALNRRSFRTAVPKAAAFLAEYEPDLVMSTHWACTHLFSMARGEKTFPLYYIYGELGETYSVINCGADLYFTLSQRIDDGLARIGIDAAHIRRIPMIVDPHMVKSDVPRDVLRRDLGIPEDNLVVVLSLGGEGIGHTLPFIDAFARHTTGASLVVLTGRNSALLRALQQRTGGGAKSASGGAKSASGGAKSASGGAVIALGYQEDISGIIGAADVLAGKCGTGYAMMAMAMGVPLIVTHLGAPNERGNMLYVVENGFGWYCPRPRLFAERVSVIGKDRAASRESAGTPAAQESAPAAKAPSNGAEIIAEAIVDALA